LTGKADFVEPVAVIEPAGEDKLFKRIRDHIGPAS
jgi:hypothetical protein